MQNIIRYIRSSISMKLSLGIVLLAVPIFVLAMGILFLQSRYMIREEAMERASSVLNNSVQRVCRFLNVTETATNVSAWLATEYLHPDSLMEFSRRIVMLNGNVDGCSISLEPDFFPQYGRYFSVYTIRRGDSIYSEIENDYEYFEKIWYKTPRKLGKECWVDFYDDASLLELTLEGKLASYCKPLYLPDGRFIGVISTDVLLRRLSKTISAVKPYPNSYFVMIGQDGHYFVHPDTTLLFSHTIFERADVREHPDVIALGHEMVSGQQGSLKVNIDGQHCLVSYQPVPGTNWSMALICPENDILQSYNRLTYILVPIIIGGLLLIMLLSSRAVAHAIRPLNRLVVHAKRIADGHYDELLPMNNRHDAVGQLQNSFAIMQRSLNQHVTDISQLNDEMARRNDELVRASQMAEEGSRQKTAFIQNMTHQIRTPLNIVMGFAQVLRDSMKMLSGEDLKSIMGMMDHNAKSLLRMVQMLFDSSDTGISQSFRINKHEKVSCNVVAREAISYTNMHFPDLPLSFVTDVPDSFVIYTNQLYLMRSLRELLYNAAKYSDGQHVSLHISQTENNVRFTFEDTGPGIAAEYRDLIFVPFAKVNDLSEGLGLGLPLAKHHITNLGGTLTLDTSYQAGCRIIIELPL